MDIQTAYMVTSTTTNTLSICACLVFFYSCCKLQDVTLGLRMIIVLSALDFIFHVSAIVVDHTSVKLLIDIFSVIQRLVIQLSGIWAVNIALFFYRLLTLHNFNFTSYFKWSLAILLSLSCILLVVFEYTDNAQYKVTMTVISLLVSLIATIIFYCINCINIKNLKKDPILGRQVLQLTPANLGLYPLTQALCLGPLFTMHLTKLITGDLPMWLIFTSLVGISLSGFANVMVFFYQRRKVRQAQLRDRYPTEDNFSYNDPFLQKELSSTGNSDV